MTASLGFMPGWHVPSEAVLEERGHVAPMASLSFENATPLHAVASRARSRRHMLECVYT